MMIGNNLFENLSNDRREAYMIYENLRKKFPQLNEQTRVEIVNYPTVRIPVFAVENVVAVYEDHWEYVGRWKKGIRAWFMRLLGTAFNESRWFNFGGVDLVKQKARIIPEIVTSYKYDEIHLERFVWQFDSPLDYHGMSRYKDIVCGYYPAKDILYIYR
jgi:hypothetical protein